MSIDSRVGAHGLRCPETRDIVNHELRWVIAKSNRKKTAKNKDRKEQSSVTK